MPRQIRRNDLRFYPFIFSIISKELAWQQFCQRARLVLGEFLRYEYSHGTIEKTLGRFGGATQQKLEVTGNRSKDHVRSLCVPEDLLAERTAAAARSISSIAFVRQT